MIITTDTKMIELNGDTDFETVGDLIRTIDCGTCEYCGNEYVLITDVVYGNYGYNYYAGCENVAFTAQAIKLGDEYEYDANFDYSHTEPYIACCNTYELVWYVPEIKEGAPEPVCDLKYPDEVHLI